MNLLEMYGVLFTSNTELFVAARTPSRQSHTSLSIADRPRNVKHTKSSTYNSMLSLVFKSSYQPSLVGELHQLTYKLYMYTSQA